MYRVNTDERNTDRTLSPCYTYTTHSVGVLAADIDPHPPTEDMLV